MKPLSGILTAGLILLAAGSARADEAFSDVSADQIDLLINGAITWRCAHAAQVLEDPKRGRALFLEGMRDLKNIVDLRRVGIASHNELKGLYGFEFDDLYPVNSADLDLGMQWGFLVLSVEKKWISEYADALTTEDVALKIGATEYFERNNCAASREQD